jgi:hypothetical protein
MEAVGFAPGPLTGEAVGVKRRYLVRSVQPPRSAFAGFRFPPDVILIAVRWYLRYGLSYRDLEELLSEAVVEVLPHQGGIQHTPGAQIS